MSGFGSENSQNQRVFDCTFAARQAKDREIDAKHWTKVAIYHFHGPKKKSLPILRANLSSVFKIVFEFVVATQSLALKSTLQN